jgi:hypothetical protein
MAEDRDVLARRNTAEVLHAEFVAIHGSLKWKRLEEKDRIDVTESSPRGASASDDDIALAEYYKSVHGLAGDGQTAVCLSGGGIRSAAFGLGILQGLARRQMLEQTHYLSTVSGGGYIGSWLAAWAHRHALDDEQKPANERGGFQKLERAVGDRAPYASAEQAPFRWLRANQKFLTPRGGIGSPDSWAAGASFLRDLILNWLVFLPLIVAAVLVPRLLEVLLQWWGAEAHTCGSSLASSFSWLLGIFGAAPNHTSQSSGCPHAWMGWLDSVGALLVIVGLTVSTCNRRALGSTVDDKGFSRWVLRPVMLGAVLLLMAICAWNQDETAPSMQVLIQWVVLVPIGYGIARFFAALWLFNDEPWPQSDWTSPIWEWAGLIVGGVLTGLLIWTGLWMHSVWLHTHGMTWYFTILGVP